MDGLAPQLSTIANSLDDLTRRITDIADTRADRPDDDVASELYEVERTLQHASRRLQRIIERS
ncbi:MAG TPA: hypothetical protein VGJ03_06865 [Acidimicrobiales bacterium]|jgi:hypothetical protein